MDERLLAISPVVSDNVMHNTRTLSNIRALTSSLFGVAAGTLGLESYPGFAFYVIASAVVSVLVWGLKVAPTTSAARTPTSAAPSPTQAKGQGITQGKRSPAEPAVPSGTRMFFFRPLSELWIGDLGGGLMSFVLTWTLFYGLCKA